MRSKPQLVIGIDPGRSIGLGMVQASNVEYKGGKVFTDPDELIDFVWKRRVHIRAIVLEDFIGSGTRDPHMVHTIQVLGYLYGWFKREAFLVEKRAPQVRRPFLDMAEELAGTQASRHTKDATAHALGWIHDRVRRLY